MVTGTGKTIATPDLFTQVVGVDMTGPTVARAMAVDTSRTSVAVVAFKRGGMATRDI